MDKKTKRIIQITTAGVLFVGGVIALILLLKNCTNQKHEKNIEIGNIDKLDLKLNDTNLLSSSFSVKYSDGSYIEKPEFSFSSVLPSGLSLNILEEGDGKAKIQGNSTSEIDEQGNFKTFKLKVDDGKGKSAEKEFKLRCLAFCVPDSPIKFQGVKSENLFCDIVENTGDEPFAVIEKDEGSSEPIEAENLVIPDYVKVEGKEEPVPVTKIEDETFKGADLEGSLTIGKNIEENGKEAFEDCTRITGELTIPDSVEEIGESAFKNCSGLNSAIKLGHKVKHIGESAFKNCEHITGELLIPESVEIIDKSAFQDCSNLTSLTLSSGVEIIADDAFNHCSSLTGELSIPETVTTIGPSAFLDCDGFDSTLTIPSSVINLGEHAFANCNHFTTLRFSGFTHNPGWNSNGIFEGWNNNPTTNLFVNSTNEELWSNWEARDYAISKGLGLNWIGELNYKLADGSDWEGHDPLSSTLTCEKEGEGISAYAKITHCQSSYEATDLVIPDYVKIGDEVLPLKEIDACVFMNKMHLYHNLTIGKNITIIGQSAFEANPDLNGTLILGEKVTNIGNYAFEFCHFENELIIPESLENIGYSVFRGSNFSSVNIKNNSHFQWANNVGSECKVLIPKDYEHIDGKFKYDNEKPSGGFAFGHLVIPEDVTTIGDHAFANCVGLTGELTIPNSVETIREEAFSECYNLSGTLTIPSSVETIGECAFSCCINIQSLFFSGYSEVNKPTGWADNIFSAWKNEGNPTVMDSSGQSWKARNFAVSKGLGLNWVGGEYKEADGSDWGKDITGTLTCSKGGTGSGAYAAINSVDEDFQATDLVIPDYVKIDNEVLPLKFIKEGIFKYDPWHGFSPCLHGNLTIGNNITTIERETFEGQFEINGVLTISDSVTNIGQNAFSGCSNITGALNIPNKVTSISSYAFSGCRNLQSLTLGENVTNIGDYAFYNCDKISSSLELPNSVTTIGNSAFENCGLLTETLTIGSDVSSIGNKAFSNCNFSDVVVNLENTHFQLANNVGSAKILIPKDNPHSDFKFKYESDKPIGGIAYGHLQIKGGPQIIGDEAFKDCNKLTGGIEIPSSVTTIGESAFEGCKGFDEDLYFEPRSNILTIGEKAFKDCSGLIDRLQLDCDKFIINSSAFANCNKITYLLLINFPEAKQKADTNWADDIFSGWDPLYDSSVEIFTGDELEPNWEARDFAVSKGLKRNWVGGEFKQWDGSDWNGHTGSEKLICDIIDENSNHPYAKITSVDENYTAEDLIIPDYVKMPNGDVVPLEEIGERSFENNCGLTGDLTIGGQIKIIGESAFQDLMNLNGTLIIKDNVKTIKPYAFSGCGCITNSLTIPNSVTSIGVCAFYECVNLQSLKLSDNLTNIGIASFYDCLSLTGELIIPGNVKTMGSHAFAYCKGLDSLIIQNKAFSSQHAIPPSAFEYCISLASIQIPSDITEIGDNAFTKCSNLEKLEFNNNNIDNIGENAFCDCISLKSISLNSLKKVSKKAFQNCRNLEGFSITFPFGAESIGDYAFAECEKITNIPFITPSSTKLKNIGEAAFINCCNLEFELQLPYSLENIGSKAFENCCKLTGLSFNNIFNSLLKNIGDSAFENCNSMVRGLSLPGSLEYIGECAFKDCSSFNQGLGFNNSPYLNPSNLTIGKQAFFNCSSFTGSLNIQPAVIEVGDSAFEGCSSFTLIEFNAFTNEPTWTGENIFSGWKESGTGSKKVYAQNGTWTSSQAFQFAKKKGLNNSWIPG